MFALKLANSLILNRSLSEPSGAICRCRRTGIYLQVIFVIEDDCYYVVHARGLTENEKRQYRRRKKMIKKQRRWSDLNTEELALATKEFDDPNFKPRVRKSTKRELAQLHRVQRR